MKNKEAIKEVLIAVAGISLGFSPIIISYIIHLFGG